MKKGSLRPQLSTSRLCLCLEVPCCRLPSLLLPWATCFVFLVRGDIGIGTIVGCGIVNTLAVPALCILMSPNKSIRLKGWSLSRDCTFYCAALITLSVALIDNIIEWYEALALVLIYLFYIL
ncbi:hypothetical protein GE061_013655, partial [Apolygus lucorum]